MNFARNRSERKHTKYYRNGPERTGKHISNMLPKLLNKIGKQFADRPDLIVTAWPEVVGSRLASMTKATSFKDGVLFVRINNSSLYSLLNQYEKPRIIKDLRNKFPNVLIKTVLFRLG